MASDTELARVRTELAAELRVQQRLFDDIKFHREKYQQCWNRLYGRERNLRIHALRERLTELECEARL